MKANLTELQTKRIAFTIYTDIFNNWWDYVNKVIESDDDLELMDQDFKNITKQLSELLQA